MDRFGEIGRDEDEDDGILDSVTAGDSGVDAPPGIGTDERRLHVRAYNYWVSLLAGRAYPSIEDLDPGDVDEFGPNSVILDFTAGMENPGISWLGKSLREECGLAHGVTSIADVPGRSLLSRLTDHYLQIIANRAPIGFEAEFTNLRGNETLYRGILMPFSSDDDSIDFVYGVISWKEVAAPAITAGIAAEMAGIGFDPTALDGGEAADATGGAPDGPAPLANVLNDARAVARNAVLQEGRSRSALYHALGRAHDFALAADREPEQFRQLIAEAGLSVQERAPMTPVVKLVFGQTYDKTRVTEYAAALAYARRQGVPDGGFPGFIEQHDGGLRGLVTAERQLRAGGIGVERQDEARDLLRTAVPCATLGMDVGDDEFVVLIARREEDGLLAVLRAIDDPALVERAIRLGAR